MVEIQSYDFDLPSSYRSKELKSETCKMSGCKVFLRSALSRHTNNILQAYEILYYCSKIIITTLPYFIAFMFLNAERSINNFTLRTYFSFLTRTVPI